jgi:glutamate transport system permease protein
MSAVLYDAIGPRTRRRIQIATAAATVAVVALMTLAILRLQSNGQLEGERWGKLLDPDLRALLLEALGNTLKAAALAMALSMVAGALLAVGRLSLHAWIRVPVGIFVEFFRGLPLLLLILFAALGLPQLGLQFSVLWYLVIGLTAYNGAVLAEIFRAGILSIDRGQREAGLAIGLRPTQVLWIILVPQAVRRMLPALISQLVTLLKDTSLGFVIAYPELLRTGQGAVEFLGSRYALQVYIAVAAVYILVNYLLSSFARWLDRRQMRRYGSGTAAAAAVDPEDPLSNRDPAPASR